MTDENGVPVSSSLNYAKNSQKSRDPEVKEEERVSAPVVSGEVIERKEPLRRKFLQAYAGDSAQSVGQYLLLDVVVPATKNLISDLVTQGINRILYGGTRPTYNANGSVIGSRSYAKYFNGSTGTAQPQNQQPSGPQMSQQARANHAFGEIVLSSRSDAEKVIDSLRELIDAYGNAKVSNLYSLVGITGTFTDQNYGWTNLARANVQQIREGYLLDLPKPEVLK